MSVEKAHPIGQSIMWFIIWDFPRPKMSNLNYWEWSRETVAVLNTLRVFGWDCWQILLLKIQSEHRILQRDCKLFLFLSGHTNLIVRCHIYSKKLCTTTPTSNLVLLLQKIKWPEHNFGFRSAVSPCLTSIYWAMQLKSLVLTWSSS